MYMLSVSDMMQRLSFPNERMRRDVEAASQVGEAMQDQFAAAKTPEELAAVSRAATRAVWHAIYGDQKLIQLSDEETENLAFIGKRRRAVSMPPNRLSRRQRTISSAIRTGSGRRRRP
jgi:argininosuccinate lyase